MTTTAPTFTIEYSTTFVSKEVGYSAWLHITGPAGGKARHCGWETLPYVASHTAETEAAYMRGLLIDLTGETVLVTRGEIAEGPEG